MDRRLLDLLVCPLCKGPLDYRRTPERLVCPADRLGFPVRDGIAVMLESEAQPLVDDEPADGPTDAGLRIAVSSGGRVEPPG